MSEFAQDRRICVACGGFACYCGKKCKQIEWQHNDGNHVHCDVLACDVAREGAAGWVK